MQGVPGSMLGVTDEKKLNRVLPLPSGNLQSNREDRHLECICNYNTVVKKQTTQ